MIPILVWLRHICESDGSRFFVQNIIYVCVFSIALAQRGVSMNIQNSMEMSLEGRRVPTQA